MKGPIIQLPYHSDCATVNLVGAVVFNPSAVPEHARQVLRYLYEALPRSVWEQVWTQLKLDPDMVERRIREVLGAD